MRIVLKFDSFDYYVVILNSKTINFIYMFGFVARALTHITTTKSHIRQVFVFLSLLLQQHIALQHSIAQ